MTEPQPRSKRAVSEDGRWMVKSYRHAAGWWVIYRKESDGGWLWLKPIPDTGQSADEVLAAWEKEQSQS